MSTFDALDGCDLDKTVDPIVDEDIPWVVLFNDIDITIPAFVLRRVREWRDLFGGVDVNDQAQVDARRRYWLEVFRGP